MHHEIGQIWRYLAFEHHLPNVIVILLGLASEAPWKQFLALRGVLQQIADLMTKEIEQLHRLEETTLTSDLAQGKE